MRALNFATPIGVALIGIVVLAGLALGVATLKGLGFRYDPFNRAEARAEKAEGREAVALADSRARTREIEGERQTAGRAAAAQARIRAADVIATEISTKARTSPDADTPIDADRLARLRDANERLCAVHRDLCPGDTATPGHAANSPGTLPAGRPPF